MVYVYSTLSKINQYVSTPLNIDEISQTLIDMGMDLKGVSEDNDPELKIEITAEKMDMISPVGIARAISSYLTHSTPQLDFEVIKGKEKVIVNSSVNEVRPKTCAAIVRNFNLDQEKLDEIIEIQEKIHESFGRHRKKAAIGIYPIDNISFPIHYLAKKPDEISFWPLEAPEGKTEMSASEMIISHPTCKKYAHLLKDYNVYPIFTDNNSKVLSLPPLINSHDTGRVETHHKDLFIECSGHNEQHLDAVLKTLLITFSSMGAEVETMDVEYENYTYSVNLESNKKVMSVEYINSLIGLNLSTKEISQLAHKVMYGTKIISDDEIEFIVPAYKFDVWSDCDIADDIARAYGYNNIESVSPKIPVLAEQIDFSMFRKKIRGICANQGMIELYTYMLTSTENQFDKMNKNLESEEFIKIKDAAEDGINMMRTKIIAELLHSLHLNRKVKYPQKVFEVGMTVQKDETVDTKARNQWHLASALAGPDMSYTQIKEHCDSLLKMIGVFDEIEFIETTRPSFIEGRCSEVIYKGEKLGIVGELHPSVLTNFGLLVPVCAYEINLELFR